MRSAYRILVIVILGIAAGAALAETIPNWSAPPTWTTRAPDRASGVKTAFAYAPVPLIPLAPCRLADTRAGSGFPAGYGPPSIAGGAQRTFTITGQCGIPTGASAVSFNFAVWAPVTRGDLRVFPTGGGLPTVSTLNWEAGILALANAAVVPLSAGGQITVQVDGSGTVDIFIDVNGYYSTNVSNALNQQLSLTSSGANTIYAINSSSTGTAITGLATGTGTSSRGVFGWSQGTGGTATGVHGYTENGFAGVWGFSTSGNGVRGQSTSNIGVYGASSSDYGVYGTSSTGAGVYGTSTSHIGVYGTSANDYGVYGHSNTSNGVRAVSSAAGLAGVYGSNNNNTNGSHGVGGSAAGTGTVHGVQGQILAGVGAGSSGVHGIGAATADATSGVLGENYSTATGAAGVLGVNLAATGNHNNAGVLGITAGGTNFGAAMWVDAGVRGEGGGAVGLGVLGLSHNGGVKGVRYNSSTGISESSGYLGYKFGSTFYAVYGEAGDMGGTGAKYFVEPHAADPSKVIRYVSLEGPESGTYFRGRAMTSGGVATIEVPDHFRMVSDEEGMTVHVTPVGHFAQIWIESQDLGQIVIRSARDVEFNYIVHGVRRAFRDFHPVDESPEFMPESAQARIRHVWPAEIKARLVRIGIYNADGTVNMQTAEKLGWAQKWRDEERLRADAARQRVISMSPGQGDENR